MTNAGFAGSVLDLVDGFLERADGVRIGGLVEADMAVADLQEREPARRRSLRFADDAHGTRHPARHGPQHASSGPGHAFEDFAPADAVIATSQSPISGSTICLRSKITWNFFRCQTAPLKYSYMLGGMFSSCACAMCLRTVSEYWKRSPQECGNATGRGRRCTGATEDFSGRRWDWAFSNPVKRTGTARWLHEAAQQAEAGPFRSLPTFISTPSLLASSA